VATGPSSKARFEKRPKKQRPNSIMLADLFLWINVVDECLYHPAGAFDRAAMTEGYGSLGNVVNRIEKLEERFGQLFHPNKLSSRNRSGVPTPRGAALAEILMLIELLFHWASTLEKSGSFMKVRKLKELILYLVRRKACVFEIWMIWTKAEFRKAWGGALDCPKPGLLAIPRACPSGQTSARHRSSRELGFLPPLRGLVVDGAADRGLTDAPATLDHVEQLAFG
jgi:hypothetical protein